MNWKLVYPGYKMYADKYGRLYSFWTCFNMKFIPIKCLVDCANKYEKC